MTNQIGFLKEQGNTIKDLDCGAFRILKTDWLREGFNQKLIEFSIKGCVGQEGVKFY